VTPAVVIRRCALKRGLGGIAPLRILEDHPQGRRSRGISGGCKQGLCARRPLIQSPPAPDARHGGRAHIIPRRQAYSLVGQASAPGVSRPRRLRPPPRAGPHHPTSAGLFPCRPGLRAWRLPSPPSPPATEGGPTSSHVGRPIPLSARPPRPASPVPAVSARHRGRADIFPCRQAYSLVGQASAPGVSRPRRLRPP
jgi:hypothetical protein